MSKLVLANSRNATKTYFELLLPSKKRKSLQPYYCVHCAPMDIVLLCLSLWTAVAQ